MTNIKDDIRADLEAARDRLAAIDAERDQAIAERSHLIALATLVGGMSRREIGQILDLTPARIQQIFDREQGA